jgi:hypothetical protein
MPLAKAILVLSGDQVGVVSITELLVRLACAVPSAFMT